MQVSVIVPARNAQATLPRTLAALADQDLGVDYEVIVVDDGSSDSTGALARTAPGPVTLVSQAASGPAAARNLGVARASGAALAFCDADVFPTRSWLRAGIEALSKAELVQGRVLPDPCAALGPFDRTIAISSKGGLWESANLFMTRKLFERVGGFPQGIWPRRGKPLAEDVLFGYRAQRLGVSSTFCAAALAHHAVFQRNWREYVGERRRLQYFPAMASKAPELRDGFLCRRVFLSRRSARLDCAIASGVLALTVRSPLPLLGIVPYARAVRAHAARTTPAGPSLWAVAAADVAADLVGLGAMAQGSLRYRSVVL